MRDIKFRAWNKKENAMREDIQAFYGSFWDILKDENWEVMQFTGLLDKNGKEIYEGDIVKHIFWGTYIITWIDGMFTAKDKDKKDDFPIKEYQDRIEVIGNVYEHPSLLTP